MPTLGPVDIAIVLMIWAMIAVVPIALILLVVRRGGRAARPVGFPSDPALDALRTRLANGEIDEIEFQHLRSVLQRR